MKDRNGRQSRLIEITDPDEQAAVLGPVTLTSPIGGVYEGRVYAERFSMDGYRNASTSR